MELVLQQIVKDPFIQTLSIQDPAEIDKFIGLLCKRFLTDTTSPQDIENTPNKSPQEQYFIRDLRGEQREEFYKDVSKESQFPLELLGALLRTPHYSRAVRSLNEKLEAIRQELETFDKTDTQTYCKTLIEKFLSLALEAPLNKMSIERAVATLRPILKADLYRDDLLYSIKRSTIATMVNAYRIDVEQNKDEQDKERRIRERQGQIRALLLTEDPKIEKYIEVVIENLIRERELRKKNSRVVVMATSATTFVATIGMILLTAAQRGNGATHSTNTSRTADTSHYIAPQPITTATTQATPLPTSTAVSITTATTPSESNPVPPNSTATSPALGLKQPQSLSRSKTPEGVVDPWAGKKQPKSSTPAVIDPWARNRKK